MTYRQSLAFGIGLTVVGCLLMQLDSGYTLAHFLGWGFTSGCISLTLWEK